MLHFYLNIYMFILQGAPFIYSLCCLCFIICLLKESLFDQISKIILNNKFYFFPTFLIDLFPAKCLMFVFELYHIFLSLLYFTFIIR